MARPQKPYQNSKLGIRPVPGLCQQPDGRWRIVATGYRVSEPDPHRAVERFRQMTGGATKPMAFIEVARGDVEDEVRPLVERLNALLETSMGVGSTV